MDDNFTIEFSDEDVVAFRERNRDFFQAMADLVGHWTVERDPISVVLFRSAAGTMADLALAEIELAARCRRTDG